MNIKAMKSHGRRRSEEQVGSCDLKNTRVCPTVPTGCDHTSVTEAHLRSTSSISQLPRCSSKAPWTHVGDRQLRRRQPVEYDQWSVDSPKESGYYSDESSIGHGGEITSTTTTSSSGMYEGLHRNG